MSVSGFSAPWWLLLFVVVAALAGGYVAAQRARRRRMLRFTNLELLERVVPKQRWSRHLPAALLIASLSLFTLGMAGPTAEQKLPRNRAVVLLVLDVSLSMEATDVRPSRIKAAQDAARSFVAGLPAGINVGLATFAGTATVLVTPTTEHDSVLATIEEVKLARSTATGEAIFTALQSIEAFSSMVGGADGPPPARIVLLADGMQTTPTRDPDDPRGAYTAAREARKRGVPISAISFGTPTGTITIDGEKRPVPADDEAMREIAELSGGEYHKAASAEDLKQVYATLGEQIGYETKDADASRPWLMLGTVVLIGAAGTSLLIGQRLP